MSTITPRTTVASNDVDVMESRAAAAHYRDRVLLKQCSTYPEAQRIVDYLSDSEFPVERTAIVARNLSFVEQVTGTMNSTKAALRGVASGAFSGFFIGLFLGLLVIAPSAWLVLLAWTTGRARSAVLDDWLLVHGW